MNSYTFSSKRYFLFVVTAYLIIAIGFVTGSELIVRNLVIPRSLYEQLRTRLHTFPSHHVAFGDSRVASGIVGAPDLANLAFPATNLTTVLDAIEFYHEQKPIHTLIFQADPHQFSPYRLNRDQTDWRDDLLKKNSPWLAMLRAPYRQFLFSYWKALPQRLAYNDIDNEVESTIPRFSSLSAATQKITAQIRANQQTPVTGFADTDLANRLVRVLHSLKASGTHICLVRFPTSRAYQQATSEEEIIGKVQNFYLEVALSTDAIMLDMWGAYNDNLFANADHLNTEGARRLTAYIRKSCLDTQR